MKEVVHVISSSSDAMSIIDDLEKMSKMILADEKEEKLDESNAKDESNVKESVESFVSSVEEEPDDFQMRLNRRLDKRLNKYKKTTTGSRDRKLKRLLDALDEKDESGRAKKKLRSTSQVAYRSCVG